MKLVGVHMVVAPLASTDANRPHVGETDAVLRELFQRANEWPHLLCAVAIGMLPSSSSCRRAHLATDEIDALTPKRTQKVSEHAISALSTLLALVGGIKKVRNIVVLASTNRLSSIDDAMLRRLSGQFFVGRPEYRQRLNMLRQLPLALDNAALEIAAACTMNFTGAALQMLRSCVIRRKKLCGADGKKWLLGEVQRVSDMFRIAVGTVSLPTVLRHGYPPLPGKKVHDLILQQGTCRINFAEELRKSGKGTGLVLVDFSAVQPTIQLEARVFVPTTSSLNEEQHVPKTELFCAAMDCGLAPVRQFRDSLPLLIQLALDQTPRLEYFQFIDADTLSNAAAFDDQTMLEVLTDRKAESFGYRHSMLVIDMDSLVGVNLSESHSNMGPSVSHSFANPKLYAWSIDCARKRENTDGKAHWIVLLCSSSFMYSSVKKSLLLPPTKEEEEQAKARIVRCPRCERSYAPAESKKLNECQRHKSQYVLMTDSTDDRPTPTRVLARVAESIPQGSVDCKWECCGARFDLCQADGEACVKLGYHLQPNGAERT